MRTILGGVLGKIPRPPPAMAVALLALLIAARGAAVAAIPSGNGTITACRDNKTGALRVIDAASQTCTSKESQLTWINGLPGSTVDKAANAANADKLDNKDSADFYAAGSKVADSEKLDGLASTEFAKAYKRTVVVSPVGTDTQNGQALLDAISNITDASVSKPYLLHIESATYDLGNGSLNMKEWVDIEGSGEINTVITRAVSDPTCLGTVTGANNAELRFLTVRNTASTASGRGYCSEAISNFSASPRLTHLTAQSTAAGGDSTATVFNDNSSPTMTDVTVTASEATEATGVVNADSSTTMTDVTATASGAFGSRGFHNREGTPTIRDSKLSASGPSGSSNQALFQFGGTAKIADSQLVGEVVKSSLGPGTLQCFNNYDQNMAAVSCP